MSKTSKWFLGAVIIEVLISAPGLSSGFGEIWLVGTLIPTLLAWPIVLSIDRKTQRQVADNPSIAGQRDPHWRRNTIIIIVLAILFATYSVIDNSH